MAARTRRRRAGPLMGGSGCGWSIARSGATRRSTRLNTPLHIIGRSTASQSTGSWPTVDNPYVSTNPTRVALADDDVLLREGLASLLERSGFEVVGQGGDAAQLIALVREHRPDLVVVDIRMPPDYSAEGLEAARVIREEFPETAVLVLSAHVEVEHALDLLASGQRTG